MRLVIGMCVLVLASCGTQQKHDNSIAIVRDQRTYFKSSLEVFDMESGKTSQVYSSVVHFEAPNWTNDNFLIYNSEGSLYRFDMTRKGAEPFLINTDFANDCNNDHLISPDGKNIAISHHESESGLSKIYTVPIGGGVPKLVTAKGPSYLHGWSPDGKTLAYCAERDGAYDVYTIGSDGGEERRLTDSEGLDDGPEYSPDGKYIYFNSNRSGKMKIWRMKADGSEQTQLTFDDYQDWFAHVSPDNKNIVFISYDTTVAAGDHPPNKNVFLRQMKVGEFKPKVLLPLFGGQGTINVPSWSPDSKRFAFVRYEMLE